MTKNGDFCQNRSTMNGRLVVKPPNHSTFDGWTLFNIKIMLRISNYLDRVLHKIPKLTHKYNGKIPCHGSLFICLCCKIHIQGLKVQREQKDESIACIL